MAEVTKNLEYVPGKLSRKDIVIVVKALKAIEAKDGIIRPSAVVASAKAKNSPLNKFFEWDERVAATKYREQQARALIGCVMVRESDSESSQPVRAFVNVRINGNEEEEQAQGYVSQSTMVRNPGLQQQILSYARNQLILWRSKFGNFEQFYGVALAIDEVIKSNDKAA